MGSKWRSGSELGSIMWIDTGWGRAWDQRGCWGHSWERARLCPDPARSLRSNIKTNLTSNLMTKMGVAIGIISKKAGIKTGIQVGKGPWTQHAKRTLQGVDFAWDLPPPPLLRSLLP